MYSLVQEYRRFEQDRSQKQDWKPVSYDKTKLPLWCGENFRKIGRRYGKFSADIEYTDAKNMYGSITCDHFLLAIAKFPDLPNDLYDDCTEEIIARRTVVQHSAVISYATRSPEFDMATQALPFFITESIDIRWNANTAQKNEAMESARWFTKSIDSMKTVSDLVAISPKLAPLVRNSPTSEENRLTTCKSPTVAFQRFQWQNCTRRT